MNKRYAGAAMFPHPRKIFNAMRILFGIFLLVLGFAGVFYQAIIPPTIISVIPSEIYSVSRENAILISSFAFVILGYIILSMKNK